MKRLRTMKAYLVLTLILGVLILPGCGDWDKPGTTPVPAGTPSVTVVTPAAGVTVLPDTKLITATFDMAMDAATLTAESFTLSCAGNQVLGGDVTYSGTGNKATLTLPAADLPSPAECTATITTAAKEEAGTALAQDYVWTFFISDTTLPMVTDVTPVAETAVLPDTKLITAAFDKVMDATTLTLDTFTLACDGTPVTADSVTYSGVDDKATLELPAATDLPNSAECTATITTGVKDLAGNALAQDYVWVFSISDAILPQVTETTPETMNPGPTPDVDIETLITATFDTDMAPLTFTTDSFTLTTGSGVDLIAVDTVFPGVSYDNVSRTATFHPANDLLPGEIYTATIFGIGVNAVTDADGNALAGDSSFPLVANDYVWAFTTAIEPLVNFGLAATFGIASTAGVTNTETAPVTLINGDVVLNPNATCNGVEVDHTGGFGLCDNKAPTINGEVITPLYPDTTTAQAITDDLRAAYLSITPANMPGGTSIAAGTTLGAPVGDPLVEGDNLFYPGVYTTATSILITGDLTLDAQGDPNATFVFQSETTIGTAPNSRILLAGDAKASNVFWQAGSDATLQTNSVWQGNILAYRDVTMVTGATSCGRVFAGAFTDGAFVFDSNVVSVPGNSNAPVDCL